MIKKCLIVAGVASALALPGAVLADDITFSGNVGLYTQYVDRGIAKSNEDPALQADFAINHSSGLYAHVWGTNISILTDSGQYASNSLELIPHLGFKNVIGDTGIGYNVGVRHHFFPGDECTVAVCGYNAPDNETTEVYGGLSYWWVGINLVHKTSGPADGTTHTELYANIPITDTGFTVNLQYTDTAGDGGQADYNDWKIGGTYALPQNFTVGAYFTGTSDLPVTLVNGKDVTDDQFVAYLSKSW